MPGLSLHTAARVTTAALLRYLCVGPRLSAKAALCCATLARCGKNDEAGKLCDVVQRLARYVLRDEIDMAGLASLHTKSMEAAILSDLASLERSPAPDTHKRAYYATQEALRRDPFHAAHSASVVRFLPYAQDLGAQADWRWIPGTLWAMLP